MICQRDNNGIDRMVPVVFAVFQVEIVAAQDGVQSPMPAQRGGLLAFQTERVVRLQQQAADVVQNDSRNIAGVVQLPGDELAQVQRLLRESLEFLVVQFVAGPARGFLVPRRLPLGEPFVWGLVSFQAVASGASHYFVLKRIVKAP